MKFKAEPNLFVRISNKFVQRATGKKGFYFDNKGEYNTENPTLIKVLLQNFEIVTEENNTANEVNIEELTEQQIRLLAKEKKIKNWHNKKIENLIEELKEV